MPIYDIKFVKSHPETESPITVIKSSTPCPNVQEFIVEAKSVEDAKAIFHSHMEFVKAHFSPNIKSSIVSIKNRYYPCFKISDNYMVLFTSPNTGVVIKEFTRACLDEDRISIHHVGEHYNNWNESVFRLLDPPV